MHEVSGAALSIFPGPRVIKYIFDDIGYGGDEAVHSDEIPEEKAMAFKKIVRKHLRRTPHAFTAYLRQAELFVVCYTKAGRKYYIEFPDLNNPEVVDD